MRNYFALLAILFVAVACKSKKEEKPVRPQGSDEFFNAYKSLKLPFSINDSTMKEKAGTATISYELFTKFIPDTVFNTFFGKDRRFTIQPVGKIEQKNAETYFISYVEEKDKAAVYVSVIDKDKFTTSMPLVVKDAKGGDNNNAHASASIDKRLTIGTNKEWTVKNEIFYNRITYAYNNVGVFTPVVTETNEKLSVTKGITNPFDTFPKRYKFSGDYSNGEKNLLFIRDSKLPNQYKFYVHFTNDDEKEPCGGELRGDLTMTADKEGEFTSNGDPCVLHFTFSDNKVLVKETGSCGNYRGIKCFFNDTYTKRQAPSGKRETTSGKGKKK